MQSDPATNNKIYTLCCFNSSIWDVKIETLYHDNNIFTAHEETPIIIKANEAKDLVALTDTGRFENLFDHKYFIIKNNDGAIYCDMKVVMDTIVNYWTTKNLSEHEKLAGISDMWVLLLAAEQPIETENLMIRDVYYAYARPCFSLIQVEGTTFKTSKIHQT